MSDKPMTFVEQCLEGLVDASDIDDFIDQWHEGGSGCSIEQYLGFTPEEYACWVEEPWSLRSILHSRKTGKPLHECLQWARAENVAARAATLEEADALEKWLRRTGRI